MPDSEREVDAEPRAYVDCDVAEARGAVGDWVYQLQERDSYFPSVG